MAQALLQVEQASFGYEQGGLLFQEASFEVAPGQLCCLFGPNGSGKTTMLDCIMNLHRLKQGRILLDGREVGQYKRHELAQRVAYVPQIHERAFPYTVKQVVMMGRTAYSGAFGSYSAEDEALALDCIRQVGLAALAEAPYTRLSGGELKLVMLARALVQQSKLILMDEPASHLDFKNELLLLETIDRLVAEAGISVVMATHEPNHAYYFAAHGLPTQVVLLDQGRVQACAAPELVLTEANLTRVYGIQSKLLTYEDAQGLKHKNLALIRTLPMREKELEDDA